MGLDQEVALPLGAGGTALARAAAALTSGTGAGSAGVD